MKFSMFRLFVLCYLLVHLNFEYNFWQTEDRDIFGKYEAAEGCKGELAVAKEVYFAKATWMIVFVLLQFSGLTFPAAIAFSFLLYSVELLLFFPIRLYSVLNLLLAAGCVVEQFMTGRPLRPRPGVSHGPV